MFKRTMIPDYACSRRTNHHPTQRTRRVQTICPYLLERWGASGQPPAASMDANLRLSRYPAIELRHYCGAPRPRWEWSWRLSRHSPLDYSDTMRRLPSRLRAWLWPPNDSHHASALEYERSRSTYHA